MHMGNGHDAVLGIEQHGLGLFIRCRAGRHPEHAGNDAQAILDPMTHFPHQDGLALARHLQALIGTVALDSAGSTPAQADRKSTSASSNLPGSGLSTHDEVSE